MKGCAKRTNLLLPEVTLAEQLGLLQCCVRCLDEFLLVVDDGEILLGQVLDLAILDLPELLRDLRDETYDDPQISTTSYNDHSRQTHGSRARQ